MVRAAFLQALDIAEHAPLADYAAAAKPLADHPLAAYLEYAHLRRRLGDRKAGASPAAIEHFLHRHAALPIANELRAWVAKEIGPIAKPKDIRFGDNLPKTRSGKIMRRLLRSVAKGEAVTQDTSTLENPAILEQLGSAH